MPPVKLHWYDGIQRPKIKVPGHDIASWGKGIVFVGDDGILLGDYGKNQPANYGNDQRFTPWQYDATNGSKSHGDILFFP